MKPDYPTRQTQPRQTQRLSPRGQELNRKLEEVVDEFRRYYPDTSDADVRQALLAAGTTHAGGSSRLAAVAATVGGLVLAAGAVLALDGGLPVLTAAAWVGIAAAAAAVILAIARLAGRS